MWRRALDRAHPRTVADCAPWKTQGIYRHHPCKESSMNGKTRAIVVVVLGMLALVAGNSLAGLLTLWRLKLSIPLEFTTWWQYARALDLPLLVWIVAAVWLLKPRAKAFHGEARFASRADLARAGLLKQGADGVIIGR